MNLRRLRKLNEALTQIINEDNNPIFRNGIVIKGVQGYCYLVGVNKDSTEEIIDMVTDVTWEKTYKSCINELEVWMEDDLHEAISVGKYEEAELGELEVTKLTPIDVGSKIKVIAEFTQYIYIYEIGRAHV